MAVFGRVIQVIASRMIRWMLEVFIHFVLKGRLTFPKKTDRINFDKLPSTLCVFYVDTRSNAILIFKYPRRRRRRQRLNITIISSYHREYSQEKFGSSLKKLLENSKYRWFNFASLFPYFRLARTLFNSSSVNVFEYPKLASIGFSFVVRILKNEFSGQCERFASIHSRVMYLKV